jgi:peptidoglycan/LPS O-acetylase OafA/YrhL
VLYTVKIIKLSFLTIDLKKNNSITGLRILFSLIIFIGHCFTLKSTSKITPLFVEIPTSIALYGFFFLSGFMLIKSAQIQDLRKFIKRRFKRIYPGYIVYLLLICYTVLNFQNNFEKFQKIHLIPFFFKNLILYPFQRDIDGVLLSAPRYNSLLNPTYTLAVEFILYIILIISVKIKIKTQYLLYVLLIYNLFDIGNNLINHVINFSIAFFIGANLNTLKKSVKILIILVLGLTEPIFLSYMMILIIIIKLFNNSEKFNLLRKLDISYGLYLYGYTILQFSYHWDILQNQEITFISQIRALVLTVIFALFSWKAVEEKYIIR